VLPIVHNNYLKINQRKCTSFCSKHELTLSFRFSNRLTLIWNVKCYLSMMRLSLSSANHQQPEVTPVVPLKNKIQYYQLKQSLFFFFVFFLLGKIKYNVSQLKWKQSDIISIFGSRNLKFSTVVELHELHEFMCLFGFISYIWSKFLFAQNLFVQTRIMWANVWRRSKTIADNFEIRKISKHQRS
jgi:hypothetical protein